jgi:hypothetical protein
MYVNFTMQNFGFDEPVRTSTITVSILSICMVCVPFALRDTEAGKASSVLFISLEPDGNQTVANHALLTGAKTGIQAFEFANYTWAHVICALAGLEALLLWVNLCKFGNSLPFTQATVLSIGGLHTANNEFWGFVGLHHVIFIMLLLSPISLHALVLFVWCIVSAISTMCEPSEEYEDDLPRGEVYFNRVTAAFFYTFISGILVVIDARMNRKSIGEVPSLHVDLLFTQFVLDTLLVVVHASTHVDITTCYFARLAYTFMCGGVVQYFLAWGCGVRYQSV